MLVKSKVRESQCHPQKRMLHDMIWSCQLPNLEITRKTVSFDNILPVITLHSAGFRLCVDWLDTALLPFAIFLFLVHFCLTDETNHVTIF